MWCILRNVPLNVYMTYCFSVNISMIFLRRCLYGSLSRQAHLQINFELLLDCLDTFSSPYLLVYKLESVHRYLLHWIATKVLCFCMISLIVLMWSCYFNMATGSDCAVAIPVNAGLTADSLLYLTILKIWLVRINRSTTWKKC